MQASNWPWTLRAGAPCMLLSSTPGSASPIFRTASKPVPFDAMTTLLELDRDSIGRLVAVVSFGVGTRSAHADVIRLRAGLIVEVQHDAVENVLMLDARVVGIVVDSKHAHLVVFEFHLVVPGIDHHRIEF